MVQAVGQLEAPTLISAAPPRRRNTPTHTRSAAHGPIPCAILTPSGALLARGRIADQPSSPPAGGAHPLRLTDVAPRGALEALFHAEQPEVVLRSPSQAERTLRIDHITGPPAGRTYWLEPLAR